MRQHVALPWRSKGQGAKPAEIGSWTWQATFVGSGSIECRPSWLNRAELDVSFLISDQLAIAESQRPCTAIVWRLLEPRSPPDKCRDSAPTPQALCSTHSPVHFPYHSILHAQACWQSHQIKLTFILKSPVSLVIGPFGLLKGNRQFAGIRLDTQGRRISQARDQHEACNKKLRWFWLPLELWKLRLYVLPKRWLTLNRLQGVISQKIGLFLTSCVTTPDPKYSLINIVFSNVTMCSLLVCYHRFRGTCCGCPEDGGSRFLCNVRKVIHNIYRHFQEDSNLRSHCHENRKNLTNHK